MISLSLKKHLITPPNTRAQTSRNRLVTSALLGAACLLQTGHFSNQAEAAELQWGRQAQTRQFPKAKNLQFRSASSSRSSTAYQDPNITPTGAEEHNFEDRSTVDHSILVERPSTHAPEYIAQKPIAQKPVAQKPVAQKPKVDDLFGEEIPADVPEEDPFSDVDDDLLPEFDEEQPVEDSTEQIKEPSEPEPTLDDLFNTETSDDPSPEEPTAEPSSDELFGNDDSEANSETPPTETEPEADTPAEAPAKEALDDPFDEPSLEQLPGKSLPEESIEQSLDDEIKRRMDELDSNPLKKEEQPADTPDFFDNQNDNEPTDDPTKLFGDPKSLGIEIGEDVGPRELTKEERQRQLEQLALEREESQKNCEDEFAKMKSDRIDDIDLSLRIQGNPGEDFPYDCTVDYGIYEPRQWAQITYNWKASGLCHKPLYFEEVQLERYGHSWGPYVQPIVSGIHFFGTVPILPYKMGLKTPNECVYTLGYYRPGSCAPYLVGGVPFTWRAALFQGGVTTGLFYAIP